MRSYLLITIMTVVLISLSGCGFYAEDSSNMSKDNSKGMSGDMSNEEPEEMPGDMNADMIEVKEDMSEQSIATFAGGCFWCTESDFEHIDGVFKVISGYTGGDLENPTYKEVSAGGTGHAEAVQVFFDPKVVSYNELLDVFWKHINPTDDGGQFVDRGSQYRSEIIYHTEEQMKMAEESRKALEKSMVFDQPIVTPITKAGKFYDAEEYHQDYYKKNELRYKYYRWGSGRDQFLKKTWEGIDKIEKNKNNMSASFVKPSDEVLMKKLTPLQYRVTQKDGTEPPYNNEYWDNKKEGIYVDIVSNEVLFSSTDKYVSGTGWPSFTRPITPENIVEIQDRKLFTVRTEVRSKQGDSHLGHVFEDGPEPTGLRYCLNSAALKFIPRMKLEEEGFGEYLGLFE